MDKTPAEAGVSVHGSEQETRTRVRTLIQARPGMALRLQAMLWGAWWMGGPRP